MPGRLRAALLGGVAFLPRLGHAGWFMQRWWLVIALACGAGCAGRSEATSRTSDGANTTAGSGGAGAGGTTGGTSATGGMSSATGGTAGTAQDALALPPCLMPVATGSCHAYFERWAFNPSTLECEQ